MPCLDPGAEKIARAIEAYVPACEQEAADRALLLSCLARFDNLRTRENPLCHFTASAWILNPAKSRVLMIYHNIYRSWAWVGGHADGAEDLLAVALKEAREETGVTAIRPLGDSPLSLEILPVDPHVKRGAFVCGHLHLNLTYLLEADEGNVLHIKPDENSGVAWMPPDEAVSRSTEPCMQRVYEKLNRRAFD